MKVSSVAWIVGGALALALAGCGEKPQVLEAGKKKPDAKAWEANSSPYVATGFKPGDQAAWEQQLRTRAQAQNEYARDVAK
jgi:hypothetical protein